MVASVDSETETTVSQETEAPPAVVLALPGGILISSAAGQFILRTTVESGQEGLDPVNLLGVTGGSVEEVGLLTLQCR